MIVAFVMINCAKDAIPELAEKLCGINGVGEVYSVTGDFDVIAIVRVIELSQVAEVVTGEIRKLSDVLKTQTHVAFEAYSRFDLEAMFSIGVD
jgi:DNA-binding Lrp family transcriptional regulator